MKVKELKEILGNLDENLEVGCVASLIYHTCGDNYCYCPTEDNYLSISNIERYIQKPKSPVSKIYLRMNLC